MIGFRAPGAGPEPRRKLGPHDYVAVRRGRFLRLYDGSDDWLLAGFAVLMLLAGFLGYALGRAP